MYPDLFLIIYVIIGLLTVSFDLFKVWKAIYLSAFNALYVLLALLVAFRYYTGTDTPSYMGLFEFLPKLDDLSITTFLIVRFQPLYTFLNVVCKTIYNDFVLLQMVQAFLFYHSFYLLLKKLNLRRFYLLFIFFGYIFLAEMAAMRECFGLAFCFYGMNYFLRRKWKLYYLFVFIGFMFHSGVIVFFLFPFFTKFKTLSVKNAIVIMALTLLVPAALTLFQTLNINIMDNAISRGKISEESSFSLFPIIYRLVLLGFFIRFAIMCKTAKEISFVYIGGVFFIMLELLGTFSLPQIYRYTSHFSIFFYYAINVVFKNSNKYKALQVIFFVCLIYSPLAKFSSQVGDPGVIYCSVFSDDSEKREMKKQMESVGYYEDYFRKE